MKRTFGPCPTCGQMFQSRDRKIFCSMVCYHRSDQFKTMLGRQHEAVRKPREERACPCCGTVYMVKVGSKRRKFCNKLCLRRYFAERHDRWVANPQTIALPQDYDEFLTKDELPCIVEGCDWVGQSLGQHVNFTHGITAAEFKELAGFNRNTGLISAPLQEAFQNRPYVELRSPEYRDEMKAQMDVMLAARAESIARGEPRAPARLERREHMRKIMAERRGLAPARTHRCGNCGKPFVSRALNVPRFCPACRPKRHKQQHMARTKPLKCAQCGSGFLGTAEQQRRANKGLPVICSMDCRAKFNQPDAATRERIAAKRRIIRGPCPGCGKMWHKRGPKTLYCSAACYLASDTNAAARAKATAAASRSRR